MIGRYEAVTAGCSRGLLGMDRTTTTRTTQGALRLLGRAAVIALHACLIAALAGCSGDDVRSEGLEDIPEGERLAVDTATSRQMQIGYQIASVAQSEHALDLCFEMCNYSHQSCHLSTSVCTVAKKYPKAMGLSARCDVARERCRIHRTKVPRQCPCEE